MRIAYIMDSFANNGGVQAVFTTKMNYLADVYGFEIFFITVYQGASPMKYKLSCRIKHIDLGIRWFAPYNYGFKKRLSQNYKVEKQMIAYLQAFVDDVKPDFLVCPTMFYPERICKIKGTKVIIESHSPRFSLFATKRTCPNLIYRVIKNIRVYFNLRFVEKNCDYLVCLTDGDASEWNIEDARITVIPNPITKCSDKTSDCSAFRVMCAGRLKEQKGFDMMIDAWNIVNKNHPNWHLYIYGEGEEENKLHAQIMKLGLENTINIMPFSHNIYEEYLKSSIFVLPSRYEGFGLVLIEAMSCGLPCVAFDCPYGPSEIIRDKEDGLIVENGNVEALANAICWMIEHNDERKAMGQRAKQDIARYDIDTVMDIWNNFFSDINKLPK